MSEVIAKYRACSETPASMHCCIRSVSAWSAAARNFCSFERLTLVSPPPPPGLLSSLGPPPPRILRLNRPHTEACCWLEGVASSLGASDPPPGRGRPGERGAGDENEEAVPLGVPPCCAGAALTEAAGDESCARRSRSSYLLESDLVLVLGL